MLTNGYWLTPGTWTAGCAGAVPLADHSGGLVSPTWHPTQHKQATAE